MTNFAEFLTQRLAAGGFSTEDTLASFLPLLRETLEAHAVGCVAPLEGLDALRVEDVRIWFEDAQRLPPRTNGDALRRLAAASKPRAVEVIAEARRTTDVDDGQETTANMAISERGQELTRPVYLPGYVGWEHAAGHHDPLTDVFSLGMILASLACGLDFRDRDDLRKFVAHRRNLFAIHPKLHPVLARVIYRMTELDRHARVQDLAAVLRVLEHYREQDIEFEFDLARLDGFERQDRPTRQQLVLSKLRERLFEVSRRNRLLHFRPTMHSVNLTHASVPLAFDVQSIRPEQILTCNEPLRQAILSGQPMSLNKYLNFAEALYLPYVLDKIQAEARRDLKEFGFAQLRLVLCFLSWTNLKAQPIERFDSPLVLLPVQLTKKKGVSDAYLLEPLSTEAEINPVVRFLFKQLYDIALPETLDLAASDLAAFHETLAAQIQRSTAAVTLQKLDRPRVEMIHEKARRKLDQYRRAARIAGRGVRTFGEIDYSYDPVNYHPLGIKLFSLKIRPPATRLQQIVEESPRPRHYAAPAEAAPVVEKERAFFVLQESSEANPYVWNFDLCSVTLANFKYRKMSLVRDYEGLLAERPENPAFDATFSLVPRDEVAKPASLAPANERYHVVPCDPTQTAAIAESHTGRSYIIQGPPGTGKSQTITNLIADYVARGRRVLFVCEKRAAIDVVYARLRQQGLDELCCLIHDSQTDKKEFVMDLKKTYEAFLAEGERNGEAEERRKQTLKRLRDESKPLEHFAAAMRGVPAEAGVPLRELLRRCIEQRDDLPRLTALEQERLPDFALWWNHREALAQLAERLQDIQGHAVLAEHPLRLLSTRLLDAPRPLEMLSEALPIALGHLTSLQKSVAACDLLADHCTTLGRAKSLMEYASRVAPLAKMRQMSLLAPDGQWWRAFAGDLEQLRRLEAALAAARKYTQHWKQKLSADDVAAALPQARALGPSKLRWLKPAWWRLRGVLRRAYDFRAHAVRPSWTQVLEALQREHAAAADVDSYLRILGEKHTFSGDVRQLVQRILDLRDEAPKFTPWLAEFHNRMIGSDRSGEAVEQLLAAEATLAAAVQRLEPVLEDYHDQPLERLARDVAQLNKSLAELPEYLECVSLVAGLPPELAHTLRHLAWGPLQLEAAIADHTLAKICRADRNTGRFDGQRRDRHAAKLEETYDECLTANAAAVRHRVRQRFLEHVAIAAQPAAQLTPQQKEFKASYSRGRRELEHEFGKTMRYKSIRDLVAGDSGEVVKDLKPVWLMSPLSVSDTLPLDPDHFDVVIFDEASQITLEEAVPTIFRARQAIVVGDEMQLPPTDFFSARRPEEEDEETGEEDGEPLGYDLDSNSFLNHAARNLPSTMLGWHYRSRSESLISFSNWAFYQGRLLTVPEEQLPAAGQTALRATKAADAEIAADAVLQRPISFHLLQHGLYDKRRNRAEAEYIAQLVRTLLNQKTGRSLGIVAFSEAQQDEIEAALQRLGQQDAKFQALLDAEIEREENGQFVGLLVKNLENIQGDERDIVILSICYARGPRRKMLMNFGPINKSGGEKRLNVAFSRAKHHMVVVSSITHAEITNDYNDGANCLKNYLRYAEAVSRGDHPAAQLVLRGIGPAGNGAAKHADQRDVVAEQLAATLEQQGLTIDRRVGQSHFRCDLAIRRPQEAADDQNAYALAILLDGDSYYSQPDVLERDVLRPRLLRAFGWRVAHVLAKDWYDEPEKVVKRLVGIVKEGD
jgi:hypothetical protein